MTDHPVHGMLELAMSQLDVALENASGEVERLSNSIAAMSALAARLRGQTDASVAQLGAELGDEAARAVLAMQFHDQLAQRLTHVREGLGEVSAAIATPECDWPAVLERVRAHYTTEDERRLFDSMLGDRLRERPAPADSEHESLRGSVELF